MTPQILHFKTRNIIEIILNLLNELNDVENPSENEVKLQPGERIYKLTVEEFTE